MSKVKKCPNCQKEWTEEEIKYQECNDCWYPNFEPDESETDYYPMDGGWLDIEED